MDCENCGAVLLPDQPGCAYCGRVSAARAHELEQRRRDQERLAHAERAEQERRLRRSSGLALALGALGILLSCFPLPTVGAFVLVADAHKRARKLAVPVPASARIALVSAVIGALLFVGLWTWMITDMERDRVRASARKAELVRVIASRDKLEQLPQDTACQVAELHLLNDGFQGDTSTNLFQDFDCAGRLELGAESASLPDFRFRTSSTAALTTVTVCFKRGSRWFVSAVQQSGPCPAR